VSLERFTEFVNAAGAGCRRRSGRSVLGAKRRVVSLANAEGQHKVNNPAPEDAKTLELIWLN
jgi:hypothetical protein